MDDSCSFGSPSAAPWSGRCWDGVQPRPSDEPPIHTSVLVLFLTEAAHDGGLLRELLELARFKVEAEVRGVEGDRKGGAQGSLGGVGVVHHPI